MNHGNNLRFRKFITRFCQLPLLFVPVAILGYLLCTFLPGAKDFAFPFVRLILATMFICYLMGSFIKFIYYKERPEPRKYTNWRNKIRASSFPSVHTAHATIILFSSRAVAFMLYMDDGEHVMFIDGNFGIKSWVGLALAIISLLFYVCITHSRIVLRKHFLIDIVFGTLLGIIAIIFMLMHIEAVLGIYELIFP